ncbi:transglycosylase SLT domain-containing protein [Nubsella zeaxanthinifaciens]|uniref:transglycosylase SLT domain-containing protein n=1 Tax=Nubsella zeaxanthinifaciens TaxID=392412 RepID=UPI000DE52F02|nr:transglycosylase SLT domain-containing protein [Nubsella zeaxanthinifaciens]
MNIKQTYINLVNKNSGNAAEFFTALDAMAKRLGIPVEWICDVMYIESGFKPTAKNPNSSASGLIQFMEATAKGLGTTTAAILKMTNVQQIPYVERYFKGQIASAGKPRDWFDTYCLVFYPVWVKAADTATLSQAAYKANSYIDLNKDGKVTKAEFRQWASSKLPKGGYADASTIVDSLKVCPQCSRPL